MSDSNSSSTLQQQLGRLRREFDTSFAEPMRSFDDRLDQWMCFSANGAGFAIAMSGLQALVRSTALTPIPVRATALLGLAVVRAQIVAVYSLARLIGIGTQTADSHWLILLRGQYPIALAVDSIEGYVLETAVQPASGENASPLVGGLVKYNAKIYAAVRAAEVYNAITRIAPENERDM